MPQARVWQTFSLHGFCSLFSSARTATGDRKRKPKTAGRNPKNSPLHPPPLPKILKNFIPHQELSIFVLVPRYSIF